MNGQVKRLNQSLINMLATYIKEDQSDWDEFIPYMLYAYQTAKHESTDETPYYLMHGRDPTGPHDVQTWSWNQHYKSIDEYKQTLIYKLEIAIKKAHKEQKIIKKRQIEQYNQGRWHNSFKLQDLVYVYTPAPLPKGRKRKLASQWKGPYRITDKKDLMAEITNIHNPQDI